MEDNSILKQRCDKFNGKFTDGKCKVDGFTMSQADFLFDHKPETQQFKTMTPRQFLNVVPPERFTSPEQRVPLKQKIKEGKEIDPLFLDVDVDTCRVLSHEGRNRAIASEELGINNVPVIIFNRELVPDAKDFFGKTGNTFLPTDRKNKCTSFIRQNF